MSRGAYTVEVACVVPGPCPACEGSGAGTDLAPCPDCGGTGRVDDRDATAECRVSGGCAAQVGGPPERCWPAEDPDVEIVRVVLDDGTAGAVDALTEAQIEQICDAAIEAAADADEAAYDDAMERRADARRDGD